MCRTVSARGGGPRFRVQLYCAQKESGSSKRRHSDGRTLDTIIELRSHCAFGAPNYLQCNDDGGADFFSRARWAAMAGETVYIIVGGFAGEVGGFSLRATRLGN